MSAIGSTIHLPLAPPPSPGGPDGGGGVGGGPGGVDCPEKNHTAKKRDGAYDKMRERETRERRDCEAQRGMDWVSNPGMLPGGKCVADAKEFGTKVGNGR